MIFFGTRFSQVFAIICISGGYQDLLPGFYQVFTLNSIGISRFQRGKPTRNLPGKKLEKIIKSYNFILFLIKTIFFTCKLISINRINRKIVSLLCWPGWRILDLGIWPYSAEMLHRILFSGREHWNPAWNLKSYDKTNQRQWYL